MKKMTVLIPRRRIRQAVKRLARQIEQDYQGKEPLLVAVLKGSFVFLSDLVRELNLPVQIDFVRLASYGAGTESSGRVRLTQPLTTPVKGRDVLVVEDIVDTGLTLSFFLDYLKRKRPSSLKLCALLDKPSRRKTPLTIDYLGLTVPDYFIVGYGLDCAEKYRQLPDLYALEGEK